MKTPGQLLFEAHQFDVSNDADGLWCELPAHFKANWEKCAADFLRLVESQKEKQ